MSLLEPKVRDAIVEAIWTRGLASEGDIAQARQVAERTRQPCEQVLNQLGLLSDDRLVELYAEFGGFDPWIPELLEPGHDTKGLTVEFLRRSRALPLIDALGAITFAVCDPLDQQLVSALRFATKEEPVLLAARPADWRRTFDGLFAKAVKPVEADERRLAQIVDSVTDGLGDGEGSRTVTAIFEAAVETRASDIHFEPRRGDLLVRLRIDGRLAEYRTLSADLAQPVVSRIKVLANLDLGERRLPQDGRATLAVNGRQVDVRVATSPTIFGEAAVLRLLDRAEIRLDIEELGLGPEVLGVLKQVSRSPHGIFLVTGPTGSGKTTTLYALLQSFAGSDRKILSVEDPVEYRFDHVRQTQVAPGIGLTFAKVLRSFLRQDPDVILVGEIRDAETASVALQAAMTGHLVLASVHANTALAVIPRLIDMGIEPYQLAAGLRGSAAQRLVRRACPHCRTTRPTTEVERAFCQRHSINAPDIKSEPKGCARCGSTGFRGRLAIGEAFLTCDAFLRRIARGEELSPMALQPGGVGSMASAGCTAAAAGETTFGEVMAALDD